MNNYLIFDIETGINKDYEKFQPELEADTRLKDEEKIKADLLKKEEAWKDKCGLNALTCEVLAIGYKGSRVNNGFYICQNDLHKGDEEYLLKDFWERYKVNYEAGYLIIGHNIKGFDLPILWRRSLKYGIKPLWNPGNRYDNQIIDTMEMWACNNYQDKKKFVSLDHLAKYFDVGEKNGKGKDFAKLFLNEETKNEALEYLKNDVMLTEAIAKKLMIT